MELERTKVNERIANMLSRMTLEEKIGQLTQFSGGDATGPDSAKVDEHSLIASGGIGSLINVTGAKVVNEYQKQALEEARVHIPLLFGFDVIHGYRTVYPIPLGLSASWNPDLVERCARMAAVEASSDGIRWTFSPMVDIARDARWGRITEGSGEDTFLGSILSAAYVRGYQGENLSDPTSVLACAKHFVGYGAAEGGREYEQVDLSDRVLRDVYLPPFKAAVESGAGTLMSAFNTLQGVPATASRWTLTEILRDEWRFDGFVVSDWNSIGELVEQDVALDGYDAALKAITAGVDMDMCSSLYITKLASLIEREQLCCSIIDKAVERVLRIKFAMNLFERPFTDEKLHDEVVLCSEHIELARKAAEESVVLLQNQPVHGIPLLPLAANTSIALIGPLADSKHDMLGAWFGKGAAGDVVTLRETLSERLGTQLKYAMGTDVAGISVDGFSDALDVASSVDVVVMALGETHMMSGEAACRTVLDLPGNQLDLLKAVVATGKPVVLVLFNGRPLTLNWEKNNVPAIVEAWFPGVQAGPALARILFGEVSPSGKLTTSFPRSVGQLPLYYNKFNTGRPAGVLEPGNGYITGYIDERNTPLFPFGWGLTYTTFEYSPTQILTPSITIGQLTHGHNLSVHATVTNTGARSGQEVVQLYIRQRGGSVTRPIRELKGFEKISLEPGESKTVTFAIGERELKYWNIDMNETVEPGELTVWIATDSVSGTPSRIVVKI